MAHKLLTKEYWNSKSEIIEAAAKGFNMMQDLPRLLQEAYPDLKSVTFGFCSKSDMPEWQAMGWKPCPTDLFDVAEFNSSDIPDRFGLVDVGGVIKWRDNYLMIMGKDFRADLQDAIHRRSDEMYQRSVDDKRHTLPGDPRANEMADYANSKLETYRAQPKDAKRGPGRPKKN